MEMYLRLLQYLKPYIKTLILSIICAGFVSLMTAANAWLVKPVLDEIFIEKDYNMLKILPFAIVLITLLKGFFNYSRAYLMRYLGDRIIQDLRNELYGKALRLPSQFHIKYTTGNVLSRIVSDILVMQNSVSTVVSDGVQQSATIIGLLCVIFYQNWKLAIITVFILPIAYYPLVRFSSRLRRISKHGQQKLGELTEIIQETISGIRLVKLFGMEKKESSKFKERNIQYFKNNMKGVHVSELASPMMNAIGAISVALIVWYGGKEVIAGKTSPGTFFSFMTACLMMYAPIRSITRANNKIQQAIASAERVFEVMDMKTEDELDDGKQLDFFIPKEISFRDASFSYDDERILSNLDLTLNTGDIIAIVGSSGAGKSTLVNLLPRLFPVTEGGIFFDDTNINDISISTLRSNIGMVSQETTLFNDTIKNNISYGNPEAGTEDIENAAKGAYAEKFILEMSEGYNTIVGEAGIKLSGGERQRIAIARVLLKNPPILILDEATSALDSESESMIQNALLNLMGGRTTFVIAHRLSTILHATKIVVVNEGRIVESGKHETLLENNGIYKKLYDLQFNSKKQVFN